MKKLAIISALLLSTISADAQRWNGYDYGNYYGGNSSSGSPYRPSGNVPTRGYQPPPGSYSGNRYNMSGYRGDYGHFQYGGGNRAYLGGRGGGWGGEW